MKKALVWLSIWAFVIGGAAAVLWDVPKWRLYDANWEPLAMTQAESWCSGKLLGEREVNFEKRAPALMKQCIADSELDNTTPNIANSVRWSCEGINAAVEWDMKVCVDTVEAYEVWFLANGGITNTWDSGNSRPEVITDDITKAPPRGERTDDGDGSRFG